ncbi:MAG: hypothetical protein PW844_05580 [Pantoea sp.]|uniref:hypothetical protein n=1 Tax=Pantoea sp. TaxID=69393 RepID=UPI00238C3332|nr:hypothetical protein [Pantoea sp.]MDE1185938.1 hypothetical protein [Pantoea sp.]
MERSNFIRGSFLKESFLVTSIFSLTLFLYWAITITSHGNNFLGSDSYIIVNKILHSNDSRWFEQTYTSQFGLQGILLSILHNHQNGMSVIDISVSAAHLFSLLTAIVFAMPANKINRVAGFPALALYWLSLALSPWVLPFSYSLYWVPFTTILPGIITFLLGERIRSGRKYLPLTLIAIAMVIRCLCGYEYITTITLFACAGYVFSLIRTGLSFRFYDLALIFSACIVGFIVAVCIHVVQLHSINENYGFSTILNRAEAHTGTDGGGDYPELLIAHLKSRPGNEAIIDTLSEGVSKHVVIFAWIAFKEYLHFPAIVVRGKVIPFGWFVLISTIMTLPCLTHLIPSIRSRFSSDTKLFSFGIMLIISAVFSWQILAWHHMTIHYHLNGQLFAYGIVPVAMVSIGSILNIAFRKLPRMARYIVTICTTSIISFALIVVFFFTSNTETSINSDFQYYRHSNSEVIAHIEDLTINETVSELYRGLDKESYHISVAGWAFSKGPENARVFVIVNGGLVGEIKPKFKRNDVYRAFNEAGKRSGFSFDYTGIGKIKKEDIKLLAPDGKGDYIEVK